MLTQDTTVVFLFELMKPSRDPHPCMYGPPSTYHVGFMLPDLSRPLTGIIIMASSIRIFSFNLSEYSRFLIVNNLLIIMVQRYQIIIFPLTIIIILLLLA